MSGGIDRRALATLSGGHLCADMCQGAVPALLPFLADQRGYSYAALGSLVLAATIGSSLVQPLFGLVSDRVAQPWLMPAGVVTAVVGIALAGLAPSFGLTVAAIALSGLGVAGFHPEGARYAGLAAAEQRGRGMSLFSVGGNAGFAVGPLLVTPLVLIFGLGGTVGMIVPGLVMALVLTRELPHLRSMGRRSQAARDDAPGRPDQWGPFSRLGAVVALRSGVYFGLQAFVPLWFVTHLHTSESLGNGALTAMLVAGALGTLAGGRLVDRVGPRPVMVAATAGPLPALVLLPFSGEIAAIALLVSIGFVLIASFSVSVVLGQQYLPNRLGLASGVTLGLAIGIGGLAATALGWVADAYGLNTVLWTIAVLPLPAIALALSLPREGEQKVRRRDPGARRVAA